MEQDSIEFLAKYGSWVSIKKLLIDESTKPEEVVFHLALIRENIDRKAFEFLGLDTNVLDSAASQVAGSGRKSYKSLAEALTKFGAADTKDVIEKACKGKEELKEFAATYLFRAVVKNFGFDFDINQQMMSKVYPDLKVKKPPGRQAKR